MSFKILCLFILLNSLQTSARGRIPIPMSSKNNNNPKSNEDSNSVEHLNLPRGFNPQSPPTNPLLYPFVTEQPVLKGTSTTPGWRPIVTEKIMTPPSSATPLLQDRLGVSVETQHDFGPIPGPVLESIVYGTWKPEPPVQPNLTHDNNVFIKKMNKEGLNGSLENVMNSKLGGFIEDIGSKKPIPPDSSDRLTTSNESFENLNSNQKTLRRKLGRRKIPIPNKSQTNDSFYPPTSSQLDSMEIIRLNSTDPALLSMVKQINESVETSSKSMKRVKAISKEWPADFLSSPESDQIQESSVQDNSFSFMGDSSEPPQSLNGLLEADNRSLSTTINITKMGVPYENQNSDEEPSICVPLAIREPSVSNPMEIVEVERVYCFPLPATEVKSNMENTNDTLVFDKDAKFNVLSYEELMASNVRGANKIPYWILILNFLLIK